MSTFRFIPNAEILRTDASFRRHRHGLGDHQSRPTGRECPEVHEMPVGGHAVVGGRVLRHGAYHDAVRQRNTAHRERREDGWWRGGVGRNREPRLLRKPAFEGTHIRRVAHA